MPELPEVETICRSLRLRILHQPIIDVVVYQSQLRWPVPKNVKTLLLGRTFCAIKRRGKYLLLFTEKGTLIIHLGLTGRLRLLPCVHKREPHEHLAICFADQTALCFIDPRKFGALLWTDRDPLSHRLLQKLGLEPLSHEFDSTFLIGKACSRKNSIKQLLMDSHIIAGIGNIYANEALFLARINPMRPSNTLTRRECVSLADAIKRVLNAAIKKGGTTIKDFIDSDGGVGYFQQELKVYGKKGLPCPNCKTLIKQTRQSGRSTFYCPKCQPLAI